MNVLRTSGIRRLSLAVCLAFIAMSAAPAERIAPIAASPEAVAQLQYLHEARLRKLHLVRPDLISYPISFDAVC